MYVPTLLSELVVKSQKQVDMVAKKTKSQKECARKTGRNFIEKGLKLAKKTGIFVFAAYRDPTHDCIVANWNLPKGEQFPDWNEIVSSSSSLDSQS